MVAAHRFQDEALTLFDLLTWRVRVAAVEQLDDLLVACRGQRLSPQLLPILTDSGWLQQAAVVLALPDSEEALFSWCPGDPTPAYAALRWRLRQRAQTAPHRCVRIVLATQQAVGLVGGSAGSGRQPLQVQHDLRTTAAFLAHVRRDAGIHRRWLSEDLIPLHLPGLFPRKRPDAVVLTEQDSLARIIEAGGVYSVPQLRNLHRSYARMGVPYELW